MSSMFLQNITQFPLGEFPVRYLEVPLIHGKLKSSHFAPLIENITGNIRERTTKTLSYVGRLELIAAIVQ